MYLIDTSEENIQWKATNGCGYSCIDPSALCVQKRFRETFTIQLHPSTYSFDISPNQWVGGAYAVEVFCDGISEPSTDMQ